MEERDNKTIMCSVFFLDIVEYSRKSVAGQISLKDRFNSYLSAAIRDVPVTDRIILDTGDGAVINFLGDIEDALKAALSLRESLLSEDADGDLPLLVRMGINLGPVRLVRDINGQPNIVGDGINVAQRVMSFADTSQILVSRSYYDAVSRLSPQYAKMFHYQGSRTDKHVREHEVYAIGYPGDKTTQQGFAKPESVMQAETPVARAVERAIMIWRSAATKLDALIEHLVSGFRQAEPQQRALYAGVVAIPLLLLIVLAVKLASNNEPHIHPAEIARQPESISQPASAVASMADAQPGAAEEKAKEDIKPQDLTASKQQVIESERTKTELTPTPKPTPKPRPKIVPDHPAAQPKSKTQEAIAASSGNSNAYITVSCMAGTEVYVDGVRKDRIGSTPLTIKIPPGKHTVIVSHSSAGVFSQDISIEAGKTVRLNPGFCNK